MRADISELQARATFVREVPLSAMFVDTYGRPVNSHRVRKTADAWVTLGAGVLYLSKREDGRYAIVDGQHRKEAAESVGIDALPAFVFSGLTYEEEAELYLLFATVNKQTPMDRFRARVEAKEPVAEHICSILADNGLEVGFKGKGPHKVMCVAKLDEIYHRFGPDMLNDVLSLAVDAWAGATGTITEIPIGGMALFLAQYKDIYKRDRLVNLLRLEGSEGMLRRTGGYRTILKATRVADTAYGMVLRDLYNQGMRVYQLPDWTNRQVLSDRGREGLRESARRTNALRYGTTLGTVVAQAANG